MLYIWIVSTILFPNYIYILHIWYFKKKQCIFTFWRGELSFLNDSIMWIIVFYIFMSTNVPCAWILHKFIAPNRTFSLRALWQEEKKVIKTCTNWIELATHWEYQGLNARLIDLRIRLSSLVPLGNTSKRREICRTNFFCKIEDRSFNLHKCDNSYMF